MLLHKTIAEYVYDGLGKRIGWHTDVNADGSVSTSDPWSRFVYDDRWRIVATQRIAGGTGSGVASFRSGTADSSPTERVVHHAAGLDGAGGSSYLDSLVMIERDLNRGGGAGTVGAWGAAADGTLETRLYFCQNWRADVVAVLGSGGAILRECRYTAYGKRVEIDAGDFDRDGSVDFFDVDAFEACFDDDDCPPGRTADANRDGFVDFMDYDAFFAAYDADLETAHGGVRTLYAGYERDPGLETQHADGTLNDTYHVRHRVYSTDLGRWTRRDPLGYVDGMSVYEYVSNQPLTSIDPSGMVGSCTNTTSTLGDCNKCCVDRYLGITSRLADCLLQCEMKFPTRTTPTYRLQTDRWNPRKGCGVVVKRNIDAGATSGDPRGAALYVNQGHEWIEFWEYDGGYKWWVRGLGFWPHGWYKGCDPSSPPPPDQRKDTSGPVPVYKENDRYTDTDGDRVVVWETTRTDLSGGGRKLQFGFHNGKKCRDASCEAILDCLRNFTPTAKWTDVSNNCRKGARDALSACCLTTLPNVPKSPTSSGGTPGKNSCGK